MSAPLIELRGIRFAYEPANPVFADLDFALEPGERVTLTGANGAGKTSLLYLIVGLLYPEAGEVHVLGRRREWEPDFSEVRRAIGLMFQDSDTQLFSPTVFDDVAFGPLNLGKRPAEVREIVNGTLETLGLAHLRDRITYRLSYGQKRLVALATILAMQPRVLLLDEPTAGLDPSQEARLVEILLSRPEEMIIVSHDPAFIDRVATRALRIEGGRIREDSAVPAENR